MSKQFTDLTDPDKKLFIELYKKVEDPEENYSRKKAQKELSEKFGVSTRSIRNWAKKLHLSDIGKRSVPAKVLVFDIETAPMNVRSFQKWGVNIGDNMVVDDWFMLSWSAKWLFEPEVFSQVVTPEEALARDDERITIGLWEMLNEADVVVAHNLRKFDRKVANSRFLVHGMTPPSPYEGIDTLVHVRKNFRNTSNRLDWIATRIFGIPGKIRTETDLWNRAVEGDAAALKAMDVYCVQDVRVLEDVYLKLRPWITPHPNIGLHIVSDTHVCPTCGGTELTPGGEYHTTASVYEALQCNDCGSWSRNRKQKFKKKDHVLSSLPR